MATRQPTNSDPPPREPAGAPVPPAVRQRLQALFERAQQCVARGDHDYANDLLTQCVVEDPGNLIYVQHFLSNLANKHGNNKKGSRFALLKIKSLRATLSKAADSGRWRDAFQAGCAALKLHPWDAPTLIQMAKACGARGDRECQVYYLRWALDADPKDAVVNRELALVLAALGHFDHAIACWRRVAQARPGDQEAEKEIARLSVDKTIHEGGYDREASAVPSASPPTTPTASPPPAPGAAAQRPPAATDTSDDLAEERRLLESLQSDPANVENYVALARLYLAHDRLPNAERVLNKALSASGGELRIREMLEDTQLRRVRQQVEIARSRAERDPSDEARQLAERMEAQANQVELEILVARTSREPTNLALQFDLGVCLQRAGKYREAIQAFQAARDDVRRRAKVQIHLGECFQHIRQFKLAATSYEAAAEACGTTDPETKKLALYRAGLLSAELGDLERAENHFTEVAAMDFGYRDVADRLDKLAAMRDNT